MSSPTMNPHEADGSWIFPGHEASDSGPELGDDERDINEQHALDPATSSLASQTFLKEQAGTSPEPHLRDKFQPHILQSSQNLRASSHQKVAEPEFVMPFSSQSRTTDSWISETFDARQSPPRRRKKRSDKKSVTGIPSKNPKHKQTKESETQRDYAEELRDILVGAYQSMVRPVLVALLSIVSLLFRFLRPILGFLVAFWIIGYSAFLWGPSALSLALGPVCALPGSSYLNLPFCSKIPHTGPVEFDQLMTVQSAFEDVLMTTAGGASLPVDMKRGESSIRDLKHVVRYSTLPSRNELVFEFDGFIETARMASSDLTRFNFRIGRAVDQVISTNRWTLQVLDSVSERDEAVGAIQHFLDNTVLLLFRSRQVTEALLLDQYIRHARAIEEEIADLILQAQALLGILQNLDDRLDVIHSIVTRDGISVQGDREELFANLWTWLGGNRKEVKKSNDQLLLLGQVSVYRKNAWEHVSGTVIKLESIAAGLEDLRERVGRPEVLGYRDDLPLRVHIENIQMGLERLEHQRLEAKKTEQNRYRSVMDAGSPLEERAARDWRVIDA